MPKIKLGFIGTGVATNELHWPALKKLKNRYSLVAACNRRRRKAEVFAKKARIPTVCNNAEELLSLKEVDTVLISLPIALNARMVVKALKAGKHVLCEKPIAANLGEARRLVKTAAKYRKKLMVAENWYFWDLAILLRKWVAQGKIGRPRMVEVHDTSRMLPSNMYYKTTWRQKPGHIGGFLVDGGVHIANTVREMFGLPKNVRSSKTQISRLLPPVDTLVSVFELGKGVQGLWKSSFSLDKPPGPIITVLGDKGWASLNWGQAVLARSGAKPKVFKGKENNYYSEFVHFHDVVARGKTLAFKPRQALADLEFMDRLLKGR